jgi:hypothetical protein
MLVAQVNLQQRLYVTQLIGRPPIMKTGDVAANGNNPMFGGLAIALSAGQFLHPICGRCPIV